MKRFSTLLALLALTLSHSVAQAPAVQSEPDFTVLMPLFGTSNAVTIALPNDANQIFMAVVRNGEVVLNVDRSVNAQDGSARIATLTAAALGHINNCPLQVLLSIRTEDVDERPRGHAMMHRCLDGEISSVRRTQQFPSQFFAPIPRETDLNTWHLLEAAITQDIEQQSRFSTEGILFFYFYISDGDTAPTPLPGLLEELPGQQL